MGVPISADSVISRQRSLGVMPASAIAWATIAGKSGSSSWRVETLTVTGTPSCGHRARRGLQHERAERADQPGLLGERDELGGRGLAPAHERLDADHPARDEVDLRLIVHLELVVLERLAQAPLELDPAQDAGAGGVGEQLDAVLAGLLGLVHGRVGVAQQRLGVDVVRACATRQPMLTRTWRRWPATSNGAHSAPRMRPAVIVAPAWSAPAHSTTNSSPPMRATVSPAWTAPLQPRARPGSAAGRRPRARTRR